MINFSRRQISRRKTPEETFNKINFPEERFLKKINFPQKINSPRNETSK
jgi:hypothetical protein